VLENKENEKLNTKKTGVVDKHKILKAGEPVKFDLKLGIHVRKIIENLAVFVDWWGNVNPSTNTQFTSR